MIVHTTAPARLGETRLPDGRLLGWAEWGPQEGTPVLLCPGAATGRSLGFGPDAVAALGIRLVSVDRPGLGASTPAPGRTFADFAADVRELCARRGFDRPAVVGNSQGAPFALACAEAGLASALALVSAADEVAAPEFAAVLPAELRALTERAVHDPSGAEEFFAGFDAERMWDLVMDGSPDCDLAVYRDPGFSAAYRRALAEGFARGAAAGYARDAVLAMGRWPFALGSLALPVDIWYGEHDTAHSPDNGALLASRVPGARRVVPGIGGALLWTHAEEILTSLTHGAAR